MNKKADIALGSLRLNHHPDDDDEDDKDEDEDDDDDAVGVLAGGPVFTRKLPST